VHPALVYSDYLDTLRETSLRRSRHGTVAITLWFILSRILCFLAALVAFALKVMAVGTKLVSAGGRGQTTLLLISFLYVLSLMNQCVGCVLLERVQQDRLFLFLFGGQDTDYRDDEKALLNVYKSRLAKQIWEMFWRKGLRFQAVVMLSTLDHYDLQRLLIEDVEEQLQAIRTTRATQVSRRSRLNRLSAATSLESEDLAGYVGSTSSGMPSSEVSRSAERLAMRRGARQAERQARLLTVEHMGPQLSRVTGFSL